MKLLCFVEHNLFSSMKHQCGTTFVEAHFAAVWNRFYEGGGIEPAMSSFEPCPLQYLLTNQWPTVTINFIIITTRVHRYRVVLATNIIVTTRMNRYSVVYARWVLQNHWMVRMESTAPSWCEDRCRPVICKGHYNS